MRVDEYDNKSLLRATLAHTCEEFWVWVPGVLPLNREQLASLATIWQSQAAS